MNSRYILNKSYFVNIPNYILACIFLFLISPTTSIAASLPMSTIEGALGRKDLHSILANIRILFPAITSMILVVAFVCGILFIIRGVWLLHNFGQTQNNMNMNKSNELFGPFLYILVGAALIYIPSTTRVFSNTIFGNLSNNIFIGSGDEANMIILNPQDPNGGFSAQNVVKYDESGGKTLLNYVEIGTGLEWLDLVNTVVMFIQMVGFIAFIRGWFIISNSIGSGAQQGTFSKGLIHLIGGVVSINFVPFMQTIADLVF